jgi:hypothetical protein
MLLVAPLAARTAPAGLGRPRHRGNDRVGGRAHLLQPARRTDVRQPRHRGGDTRASVTWSTVSSWPTSFGAVSIVGDDPFTVRYDLAEPPGRTGSSTRPT